MELEQMYEELGIQRDILNFAREIEGNLKERFRGIDETAEYNHAL